MKHARSLVEFVVITVLLFERCNASQMKANRTSGKLSEPHFPPEGYHKNFPFNDGSQGNESLRTGLVLWLESVTKVDVSIMQFEVYGYVVQEWTDSRLEGISSSPYILRESGMIWLPDVYCVNCRESTVGSSSNQNSMIRIGHSGDVYYSQGVRLAASCPMYLMSFPFDKQRCSIQFASYSYNTSFVQYFWNGPVVLSNYELDQFTVEKVTTSETEAQYKSGKYTILSAEFLFVRRMGFYIIQVYLPTAMLVSLSWITFYMNPGDIGDRLTIGITLILTMIFMLGYINTSLPKVSYIKAIDWYLISSLIIIILGVVEGVIAYGLHFKYTKKEEKKIVKNNKDNKLSNGGEARDLPLVQLDAIRQRRSAPHEKFEEIQHNEQHDAKEELLQTEANMPEMAGHRKGFLFRVLSRSKPVKMPACYHVVDTCSKILFPLVFIIYNVLYFWMYHREQWQE